MAEQAPHTPRQPEDALGDPPDPETHETGPDVLPAVPLPGKPPEELPKALDEQIVALVTKRRFWATVGLLLYDHPVRAVDAADPIQDIVMQLYRLTYRNPAYPDSITNLEQFMLTSVRHRLISLHRELTNRDAAHERRWRDRGLHPRLVVPDLAETVIRSIMVRQALAELPPREQQAVILRYCDGLSTREVASRMGIAKGTVTSSVNRATAKLRRTLQDLDPHHPDETPSSGEPEIPQG